MIDDDASNYVVAHFCDEHLGHLTVFGHDCWCEPHVRWYVNKNNILVHVIEHDDAPGRYGDLLTTRHIDPDWVTDLLNSIPV